MKIWRWNRPLLLSTLVACAWWAAGRPNIEAFDRLTFSHALHGENDVECDSCHEGVELAKDTSTSFLPMEAACMECHEREDNCVMCHSNAEKRKPRLRHVSALGFSHVDHLGRIEEGCPRCHQKATTATELPTGRPTMDICLRCHNHQQDYAAARCTNCHPALNRMPLKAVAEFDHDANWLGRHGMMARSQGNTCQQCHTQTKCAECHSRVPAAAGIRLYPEQVGRAMLHRGDWMSAHPIEARADGDLCLRCHQPSDCMSCHTASGVTPRGTGVQPPHPAGYAVRGGSEFHGDDARLRIETCAACHDQGPASNCVECHSSGGPGGNPHPRGWKKRYEIGDTVDNTMCTTCHRNAL